MENIADVRDGLTEKERAILTCLNELRHEFGERYISTSLLYGRVVEKIDISIEELQSILQRLTGNNPANEI